MSKNPEKNIDNLEQEVDSIIQTIDDPHGVIDDEGVGWIKKSLAEIHQIRKELAFAPYKPVHNRLFVCTAVSATASHRDRQRDDGTPYVRHLRATAENLSCDQHLTGLAMQIAALRHDDKEELEAKDEELVPLEKFGIRPDRALKRLQQRVIDLVNGVTKIQRATREDTKAVTFRKLLEAMRDCGVRVGNLKIADRQHNVSTIDGHFSVPRQRDIISDTEDIYVPLAIVLGVRRPLAKIVDSCVDFLNPDLLAEFSVLRKERMDSYGSACMKKIERAFGPEATLKSDDAVLLEEAGVKVIIKPSDLADFAIKGIPFESLKMEDLDISPLTPMFEVIVTVNPETRIEEMVDYVERTFGKKGHTKKTSWEYNSKNKRAVGVVRIQNEAFGGRLHFRVTDSVTHARSQRGVLADFSDELSPYVKDIVSRVLKATAKDPARVFDLAGEEFLRQKIIVYTIDHEPKELPIGATALDFAAQVHSDFLIHLQGARCEREPLSDKFEAIDIFDALENETLVRLEVGGEGIEIKVDPGWLLFCKTENARDVLRKKFLRSRGREDTIECGRQYVDRISDLFMGGKDEDKVLNAARRVLRMESADDEEILYKIGRGDVEIVEALCDDYLKNIREWNIWAKLVNTPGVLEKFGQCLRKEGVNIEKIYFPMARGKILAEGEIGAGNIDISSDKTPFEMMRFLLKISYKFNISVSTTVAKIIDRDKGK